MAITAESNQKRCVLETGNDVKSKIASMSVMIHALRRNIVVSRSGLPEATRSESDRSVANQMPTIAAQKADTIIKPAAAQLRDELARRIT